MMDTSSFFNLTLIEPLLVQTIICSLHPTVFYTWTIVFCDRYINFYLCRLLCQRAGLLFRDLCFSGCFCSIEPSLRLCEAEFQNQLLVVSFGRQTVTVLYESRVYRVVNSFQNAEHFGLQFIILDTREIPGISRHSFLEFFSFLNLFRSTLIRLSDSLELTFLDIFDLVNLVLSLSKLFFKSSRIELNLPY